MMSIGERTISAAGAAVISAIIVNPLDVAKTRLQAQAAGVPYQNCIGGHMASRNTNLEGYARLWRGTNASLALAIPTVGIYLPCYDIFGYWFEEFAAKSSHLAPYAPLIAGSAARSLACIVCSPIELARTRMQAFGELQAGEKPSGVWKTLLSVPSPTRSTKYICKNLVGIVSLDGCWVSACS